MLGFPNLVRGSASVGKLDSTVQPTILRFVDEGRPSMAEPGLSTTYHCVCS